MTIRDTNPPGNDNTTDPEVSFDPNASVSPVASAPPANNLPIASATAIPIVSATAVPEGTPSPLSDGSNIERITNSDGSLLVKVTNTTSNPDGVIVRVEEYEVPANMANSVIQSMDMTGDAPSSLYLTKIEDHRLPPQGQPVGVVGDTSNTGVATAATAAATGVLQSAGTAYPTTSGGSNGYSGAAMVDEEERQRKIKHCALAGVFVVAFLVMLGINVVSRSSSSGYTSSFDDDNWITPTYPTNDDLWNTPTYPTNDDLWTWTFPPAIYMPQTPTKSPSPTNTPYPTWVPGTWSYQWPGYAPLFSPTASPDVVGNLPTLSPGTPTSYPDKDQSSEIRVANKASAVKKFIRNGNLSPTFTRDPTAAQTPRAISRDIQETLVKEENKIATSARI